VLKSQEKEKKWKYLEACLEQRHHFTPFVVSTDGMMGREASTFAKCLSAKLAEKWQKYQYSAEYCYSPRDTPVPARKSSAGSQHQRQTPTVGGWCWISTV
jgi:hypothetical protein